MSLTLRGQKGQKLTTQDLDDNFKYLESLSSTPPQTNKIPFTTSESVNAGKIAQVLFDGTVKEFKIEDLTENN